VPYIQNLAQFVRDAAIYILFILILVFQQIQNMREAKKKQTPGPNAMSQTNLLRFTRNYN
jgi:hypothetical protein